MTTFDDRDKSFENKFAHDEELNFKANARRNKLLGLWAAEKLGKGGAEADQYAKSFVESMVGNSDVAETLAKELDRAGITITPKEIRAQMDNLLQVARKQIMGEAS